MIKKRQLQIMSCLLLVYLALGAAATQPETRQPDATINLWPGLPPGATPTTQPQTWIKSDLTNISTPTLEIFRPDPANDTHTAILICPGGGFTKVVIQKEGESVANWLNSLGITGIVLKYRVPYPLGTPKYLLGMQDAQRAMCLIRSKAADWKFNPNRIGIIGFSAGGKIAADVSTNFDKLSYIPVDAIDQQTSRPNFAMMIYPGELARKDGTNFLMPDLHPTADTPPTFIAITTDDKNGSENAIDYYQALKAVGVNAELHIYSDGLHGFAFRPEDVGTPHSKWTQQAADWMTYHGFLQPPEPAVPDH
jgi:acetyl esterase/lipase